MTDYAALYDDYWAKPDRLGSSSLADPDGLARDIVTSCGFGRYLDVGSGMGHLVRSLLALGIDAEGVDVSSLAVGRCNDRTPGRFQICDARKLPFEDGVFDTVVSTDCLEHLEQNDLDQCISELVRVARKNVYLQIATRTDRDAKWHLTVQDRDWWEDRLIKHGLRRHPLYFDHNLYQDMGEPTRSIVFIGQKVTAAVDDTYPISWLLQHRDLHMDMGRETGARSDAHLIRYDWARRLIKTGDVVVDAACGLGYGSWMLKTGTRANEVIGIDANERAITYCRRAFETPGLSFEQAPLPDALLGLKDIGVNAIVCFETLEHLDDPVAFLETCWQVLLPGGRIIVSVPNDWADETGVDPNPHHFHVYDWHSLKEQLSVRFQIDMAIAQTATRSKTAGKWQKDKRRFVQFDADQDQAPESEWLLATGQKYPLAPDSRGYIDRRFPDDTGVVTDFAKAYENPWIAQNLVFRAARSKNPRITMQTCTEIISAGASSVDVGAALCVLGYQVLEGDAKIDAIVEHRRQVELWLKGLGENPHEIRWAISNLFLLGRMAQGAGDLSLASDYFRRCSEIDPLLFNPTIATKTIEACYRRGVISWSLGHMDTARSAWRDGMIAADRVRKADWGRTFGDPGDVPPYIFDEMQTCIRLAGCCLSAARATDSPEMSRRDLSKLFEQLLGTRSDGSLIQKDQSAPSDQTRFRRFGKTEIQAGNGWSRETPKEGRVSCILHPTDVKPVNQPKWRIALIPNRSPLGIAWSAVAGNPSEKNLGACIEVEILDKDDRPVEKWAYELKPRQRISHWFDGPLPDGAATLQFMVLCQPFADTVACAGVYIEVRSVI